MTGLKTIVSTIVMLFFLAMSFIVKDVMYSQLLSSASLVTGVFAIHCMSYPKSKKA